MGRLKKEDKFAVDFANWISKNGFREYSNGWASIIHRGRYTTIQLLNLYKNI